MSEINVKITEINNAITKLQGLQLRCASRTTTPPATVGGGKTVNELEDIAKVYKNINTNFGELNKNTIMFLQNIRDSYISSDTKATKHISGRSNFGGDKSV